MRLPLVNTGSTNSIEYIVPVQKKELYIVSYYVHLVSY